MSSMSCSAAPMPFVNGGGAAYYPQTAQSPIPQQPPVSGGGAINSPMQIPVTTVYGGGAAAPAPVAYPPAGTVQLNPSLLQQQVVYPAAQQPVIPQQPAQPDFGAALQDQLLNPTAQQMQGAFQQQAVAPQPQVVAPQQPVANPQQPVQPAYTPVAAPSAAPQASAGAQALGGGGAGAPQDLNSIVAGLQQAVAALTQMVQMVVAQQAQMAQSQVAGGGGGGGAGGADDCCGAAGHPSSGGGASGAASAASGGGAVVPKPSPVSADELPPIPSTPGPAPSSPPAPAPAAPVNAVNPDGSVNWEQEAKNAAIAAGIDPEIYARQIKQESGFNPTVSSPAGAQGIAQIMPATAKAWGVDPMDPKAALKASAEHMRQYLDKYNGDWAKALAAYNAGEGAVAKYGGVPPFKETQNYVKVILQQ